MPIKMSLGLAIRQALAHVPKGWAISLHLTAAGAFVLLNEGVTRWESRGPFTRRRDILRALRELTELAGKRRPVVVNPPEPGTVLLETYDWEEALRPIVPPELLEDPCEEYADEELPDEKPPPPRKPLPPPCKPPPIRQRGLADRALYFGKHRGKPLKDVPTEYLRWLLTCPPTGYRFAAAQQLAKEELQRRGTPGG